MPNALRIPCEGSIVEINNQKFEVKKERGRILWVQSVGKYDMSKGFSSNQFDNFKINGVKYGIDGQLKVRKGILYMTICAGKVNKVPEEKKEEPKPEVINDKTNGEGTENTRPVV